MRGEKIYEYHADLTSNVDFGVELAAILEGRAPMPAVGARFDGGFEGRASGRISGRVSGIDYAHLRPDGSLQLNIHGMFETDDGHRISLAAGGVGLFRADMLDLSENVTLLTASKDYAWVNARQIWAVGSVNLTTGKLFLEGYLQ